MKYLSGFLLLFTISAPFPVWSIEALDIPVVGDANWVVRSINDLKKFETNVILRSTVDSRGLAETFVNLGRKIREPIGFFVVNPTINGHEMGPLLSALDCSVPPSDDGSVILITSKSRRNCQWYSITSPQALTDLVSVLIANSKDPCKLDFALNAAEVQQVVNSFKLVMDVNVVKKLVSYLADIGTRNYCP